MSYRATPLARISRLAALTVVCWSAAPLAAGQVPLPPVGVSAVGGQFFENEDLLAYQVSPGDELARAIAAGDFDGDGADDLATGIPFHDGPIGSTCLDCGIVVVRYGVPGSGLAGGPADTVIEQGLAGSPTPADPDDRFGWSLAAGDFDGDGFDDLAVGVPYDRSDGDASYGSVVVYRGGASGIELEGAELLHEGLAWTEVAEPHRIGGDEFGFTLAVGNFDGDAFDDLAIGTPRGTIVTGPSSFTSCGEVFVAHGSADGLLPLLGYGISQASVGIFGDPAGAERFGVGLAAGDFDGDGDDDLAIGVPNEGDAGGLHVILGSPFGLIFADSVFWAPGALGQVPEAGDRLGYALAAGDFDGDGHDDLAVGDPSEDLGPGNSIPNAGSVSVAYGVAGGFDLSRTVTFTQAGAYFDEAEDEAEDELGWVLVADDFDGDGFDDLVAGHPGENELQITDTGAAMILMGAPGAALGAKIGSITAGLAGVPGNFHPDQEAGRTLATGDFDGDGHADLVVGIPRCNSDLFANVGCEIVVYGSLFSDGFETANLERWSDSSQL